MSEVCVYTSNVNEYYRGLDKKQQAEDMFLADIEPYLEIIKKAVQNIKDLEKGFEEDFVEVMDDEIDMAINE